MSRFSRARSLAGLALVATTLQVGLIYPDLASAQIRSCGKVEPYFYGIKADRVSCAEAKRVAKAWQAKAYDEGSSSLDNDVRVRGFRCRFDDGMTVIVRCHDGVRFVKFNYNF